MDTALKDSPVETEAKVSRIVLERGQLLDLLTGTSLAVASPSVNLPTLECVWLEVKGTRLIVAATDRYRLITGSVVTQEVSGDVEQFGLPIEHVRNLILALKVKNNIVNTVTVEIDGTVGKRFVTVWLGLEHKESTPALRFPAHEGGQFPPYEHLFDKEVAPVSKMAFNPTFLWVLSKIPQSKIKVGTGTLFVTFHGDGKPVVYVVPHDSISWRALLMPMKYPTEKE
jgi:hypothetical protein